MKNNEKEKFQRTLSPLPLSPKTRSHRRGSTGGIETPPPRSTRRGQDSQGRRHSAPQLIYRSPVASPLSNFAFKLDKHGKITLSRSPRFTIISIDENEGEIKGMNLTSPKNDSTVSPSTKSRERSEKSSPNRPPRKRMGADYSLYDKKILSSLSSYKGHQRNRKSNENSFKSWWGCSCRNSQILSDDDEDFDDHNMKSTSQSVLGDNVRDDENASYGVGYYAVVPPKTMPATPR